MELIGIVVGATYGALISYLRRFPVWARGLIVSMALVALVLAGARIYDSSDTAGPWMWGLTAFALTLVALNLWQALGRRRTLAHR